jgi:hypothetical protein
MVLQLAGVDGGEVAVESYRGRTVVLHVFSTWAEGALQDVDQLKALYKRGDRRVAIIGVALDPEGARFVIPWRRALAVPYVLAVASPAVREGNTPLGHIAEVPTTILLGPDGRELMRLTRALAPGELERLVAQAQR